MAKKTITLPTAGMICCGMLSPTCQRRSWPSRGDRFGGLMP